MLFRKRKWKLRFDEYSELLQEVTRDVYHQIFTDKETEKTLSLNNNNRNIFAVEYVFASLFLMVNNFSDSHINQDISYKIMDDVTNKISARILDTNATPENLQTFKTHYLKRSKKYDGIYDRSAETLLEIAKYLVGTITESDKAGAITYSSQLMFTTDMLMKTLMSYRNILDKTTVIHSKQGYLFEVSR